MSVDRHQILLNAAQSSTFILRPAVTRISPIRLNDASLSAAIADVIEFSWSHFYMMSFARDLNGVDSYEKLQLSMSY